VRHAPNVEDTNQVGLELVQQLLELGVSNLPAVAMFAGSTMVAPADFIAAIASSITRSTASLKPKKFRATDRCAAL
jgi:hypothetical protein